MYKAQSTVVLSNNITELKLRLSEFMYVVVTLGGNVHENACIYAQYLVQNLDVIPAYFWMRYRLQAVAFH